LALGAWVVQAPPVVWPWVMFLAVPVVIAFLPRYLRAGVVPRPEDLVRICGLAFQLFGIWEVVKGLRARQVLFKRERFMAQIRSWLSGFPRGLKTTGSVMVTLAAAVAAGTGRVSAWIGAAPDSTVEARVAVLEANILTLRRELKQTDKELREESKKRAEVVTEERQVRETADAELRGQLEGFGAEGISVEMAGVQWLVTGAILATVPGEIARLIAWLFGAPTDQMFV